MVVKPLFSEYILQYQCAPNLDEMNGKIHETLALTMDNSQIFWYLLYICQSFFQSIVAIFVTCEYK